jgi:hypothetical protein
MNGNSVLSLVYRIELAGFVIMVYGTLAVRLFSLARFSLFGE